MDIVGDRRYVELPPADHPYELPPLLVRMSAKAKSDKIIEMSKENIDQEELIPLVPVDDPELDVMLERRRMGLALAQVDRYLEFKCLWQWGDGIMDWIRQCEETFEMRAPLRSLLRADIWPHASRKSFVDLLIDKGIQTNVPLHSAVGARLSFRHLPPIHYFTSDFLQYLNGEIAASAFNRWAHTAPDPVSSLPPERFSFDVINTSLA